jgi:predicted nicotinamide N-methyase
MRMRRLDPTVFIRTNLPVVAVPGIPEIKLHKASPISGLWRLARQDEDGFGAPYWAHYWAGGLALARYVLDNPNAVAGLRVLDLGAGSGLVGIAAAKAGARAVVAAEVDRYAVAALTLNMKLNGVSISVAHGDLTDGDPPREIDLVLAGDLFYATDLSERVTAFLDRCSNRGIRALIGDPWRAHLPTSRLKELARYVVTEGGSHGLGPSGVFAFVANPPNSERSET